MAINITKLINAVSGIVGNLDSDNTLTELNRGTIAAQEVNEARDALSFATVADFETADSTNEGNIVYASSTKQYYVSIHDRWAPINLTGPSTTAPAIVPYSFQGDTKAYAFGGGGKGADAPAPTSPVATNNVIDSWPFASDGNATDVGDLTNPTKRGAGVSSATAGYDFTGAPNSPPDDQGRTQIDKFVFASDTSSSIAPASVALPGQFFAAPVSSSTKGYAYGGGKWNPPFPGGSLTGTTQAAISLTYASDADGSTSIGPYTFAPPYNAPFGIGVVRASGFSSPTEGKGYHAGGGSDPTTVSPFATDKVYAFPFASETVATIRTGPVLTVVARAGVSSPTEGFLAGGRNPSPPYVYNTITKFPFASDTSGSDHGDLVFSTYGHTGHSGETYGHFSGGYPGPSPANAYSDTIQKIAYASNTTGTDIGNMTVGRYTHSGWQN